MKLERAMVTGILISTLLMIGTVFMIVPSSVSHVFEVGLMMVYGIMMVYFCISIICIKIFSLSSGPTEKERAALKEFIMIAAKETKPKKSTVTKALEYLWQDFPTVKVALEAKNEKAEADIKEKLSYLIENLEKDQRYKKLFKNSPATCIVFVGKLKEKYK